MELHVEKTTSNDQAAIQLLKSLGHSNEAINLIKNFADLEKCRHDLFKATKTVPSLLRSLGKSFLESLGDILTPPLQEVDKTYRLMENWESQKKRLDAIKIKFLHVSDSVKFKKAEIEDTKKDAKNELQEHYEVLLPAIENMMTSVPFIYALIIFYKFNHEHSKKEDQFKSLLDEFLHQKINNATELHTLFSNADFISKYQKYVLKERDASIEDTQKKLTADLTIASLTLDIDFIDSAMTKSLDAATKLQELKSAITTDEPDPVVRQKKLEALQIMREKILKTREKIEAFSFILDLYKPLVANCIANSLLENKKLLQAAKKLHKDNHHQEYISEDEHEMASVTNGIK